MRKLAEPTVLQNGKRLPGLKLDHPRQPALMHALVHFSHIAAEGTFTTSEIHARSRRYRLLREGYSICLVFLKLFERIYAPLTAGLLRPFWGDTKLQQQKRSQLDRLSQRVVDDLDKLMDAVGLIAA